MPNWEEQIDLPKKPDDMEYGYMAALAKEPIYCNQAKLLAAIEDYNEITLVAVPDEEDFIVPGSNYETLQPVLKARRKNLRKGIKTGGIYTLLILGFMILFDNSGSGRFWEDTNGKIYLLIFGILPMLNNYLELRIANRINKTNYLRECREIKFSYWLRSKMTISIYVVVGLLTVLFLLQFKYGLGDSIELAGLVKTETRNGDWWRLFTCTLMHASIIHIAFNALALYVIGLMVIKISGFFNFIFVFLFAALSGSLLSFFLTPAEMSVGASGGIMGLIGYILVLSIKSKDIPRNILKSMITTIIMMVIIGISAYEMIDNAAHLGGLLGGIIIALLFIRNPKLIPLKESIVIKVLGIMSLLIICSTAVGIAYLLL